MSCVVGEVTGRLEAHSWTMGDSPGELGEERLT